MTYGQWVNDPSQNTIINSSFGAHYVPKVIVGPSGDYFFSWYGGGANLNMNLTHTNHKGIKTWSSDMVLSAHPQNSWVDDYTMISDLEGNAIIVFSDIRNGNKDVVAYKVDSLGNQVWGDDGIVFPLSNSDEYQPTVVISSDNNAFVLYSTNLSSGSNYIKVHSIAPDGTLTWGNEGKTFSGLGVSWALPLAVADAEGGITIAFYEETGSFPSLTRNISAIRIDSNGDMVWSAPAVITDQGGISAWDNLTVFGNMNGGIYVTWHDDRYFNNTSEVYSQYIDELGQAVWEQNGLLLGSEGSGPQLYEVPCGLNNSGEFIVFWNLLNSSQSEGALKYQRISASGQLLEGNPGATIIGMNEQLQNGVDAFQFGDTSIYVYNYFFSGSSFLASYNAIALDANGDELWDNPIEISNSQLERTHADMSDFNAHQSVITWSDDNNGSTRVMAQNFFTDGNLGSSPVFIEENENLSNSSCFIYYQTGSNLLSLQNLHKNDYLRVYNSLGQSIYSDNAQSSQHIGNLEKGLYIGVIYRNGKNLEQFKFIN